MQIDLKPTGFPFFKVVLSFIYLLWAVFLPVGWFISIILIFFSKIHTLGAFMAMWRAKRLTWVYVFWMSILFVIISYLGVNVLSIYTMSLVTFAMFAFHFIYDEYELQEEKRTYENVILMLCPLVLMYMVLFQDYFPVKIDFTVFLLTTLFFLVLEALYIRKINWIFISSKVLVLFFLATAYFGYSYTYIYYNVLMIHYFFWLAFPIYKLNKYVPEERDDFIMMFVLLVMMSAFVYSTAIWPKGADAPPEILQRTFYIASIVHFLSTAPFGYFFGLRKKKYDQKNFVLSVQ